MSRLVLDPRIPASWKELHITLRWHGRRVRLRCRSDAVQVSCASTLRVQLGDDPPVLVTPPGGWVERGSHPRLEKDVVERNR